MSKLLNKIAIKPIFGAKSKDELISASNIIVSFFDSYFTVRTNYTYKDGETFTEKLINEKSFFKKSAIENIGIGWDAGVEIYFIAVKGVSLDAYINLISAEVAEEMLDVFTKWWLEL